MFISINIINRLFLFLFLNEYYEDLNNYSFTNRLGNNNKK